MAICAAEQDRDIALETIKHWFKEKDAAYLAKENLVVYWLGYNPESKMGSWNKLSLRQAVRVIRATRAGFSAMKYVNPELILLAAQEEERAYAQGVKTRSKAPPEFFNFNKVAHFTDFEMLTLCTMQALVGRGWNVEINAFGLLLDFVFKSSGWTAPNRILRGKLIRAVADEAGMLIRDRKNRLSVYKVGRFVALQIEGIDDSIKTEFSDSEMKEIFAEVAVKFSNGK